MPRSTHGDGHWHWQPMTCNRRGCESMPDLIVPMGPISGLSGVAEELIRHFEIDPAEHEGLLLEVEFAIGDQMLDTMREILTERGIPIPAEVDAAPMAPTAGRGGAR